MLRCILLLNLLLFLTILCITYGNRKRKQDEYDFIVIGGGLAGCAVAARLSRITDVTVLLLEAGGPPPLFSQIPAMALLMENPKYNWNFSSVPQRNVNNRIYTFPPGKMLGGSGTLNWFNWVRANKRDFELWEKMGVKGWLWEDVLPYYKIIETDFSIRASNQFSGFSGPININDPSNGEAIYLTLLSEFRKLDYNYNDALDGDQTGFNVARVNVHNNERMSSYTNYLIPALERKNLKVIHSATVEKIIFNKQNRAIGVVYNKHDERFKVNVKREVIVSTGALNTPKILMLSGIGPRKHLESYGVDVISDLKVGDNYHDHYSFSKYFSRTSYEKVDSKTIENLLKGKGPFKNFTGINAFMNTDLSRNHNFPDVHFQILGPFYDPTTSEMKYNMEIQLQRPKSRGTIRLASKDPSIAPLIDTNYFDEESDFKVTLRLAQFYAKLGTIISQSQNEYSFPNLDINNCERNSKDFWRCVVKNNIEQSGHHCCTARMGSPYAKSTVVDNKLKVIGVQNVRIIDASIMPTIVSANTQATVLMIAEKGCDLIKKDHFESF